MMTTIKTDLDTAVELEQVAALAHAAADAAATLPGDSPAARRVSALAALLDERCQALVAHARASR